MVTTPGGLNRTQGTRLNELNLGQGQGQDQGIQGLSDKALADLISKFLNPQNAQAQPSGGGGQPSGGGGGPQQASGTKGGSGDPMFSLEELMKEAQRRDQARQIREANNATGGRQTNSNGQQALAGLPPGMAAQMIALAPPDLVAQVNGSPGGGLTSGGGGSGGGALV